MDYAQETEYSGSSNYVDIPTDTNDSNSTSWSVISQVAQECHFQVAITHTM